MRRPLIGLTAYAQHVLYNGNEVMAGMIRGLRITTRLFEIARLSDRVGPDSREHRAIVDALAADDARGARRAAQAHIRSLSRFALATVA